jgi:hypothetical protein
MLMAKPFQHSNLSKRDLLHRGIVFGLQELFDRYHLKILIPNQRRHPQACDQKVVEDLRCTEPNITKVQVYFMDLQKKVPLKFMQPFYSKKV